MYMMNVDTLTVLQQERHRDFQRQAELLRLLRAQNKPNHANGVSATNAQAPRGVLAALRQIGEQIKLTVLPLRSRAVPRR